MSSRAVPTARNAAASRPRRRAGACSPRLPSCSPSAASRAPRSPPSPRRRASRPRPSTRASATSARCSARSSGRPRGAATTRPVPEQAGPARDRGQQRSARAAAPVRGRHRPAPRARRPAARGALDRPRAPIPSWPSCARRSTTAARGPRHFIDALAANGPLRLDLDAATESVWALASPELHQLLTRTRGWTRERYCAWLADSLTALLLAETRS